MNQSKYSRLVIIDEGKGFFDQCFPEFKVSRNLRNDKYLVEKNYKNQSSRWTMQNSGTSNLSTTTSIHV
jgi:hypothetical protein